MSANRQITLLERFERWLLRAILLAVVLLALLLAFAAWHSRRQEAPAAPATPQAPASSVIMVVVDFGDGVQKRISGLPFTPGMTVHDAMNLARDHPHPISFVSKGHGQTALLTQIDDVANEGAGSSSRAWQYWVNTQYGQTSIGAAALHAGDRVSWAFKKYESNPGPPPP